MEHMWSACLGWLLVRRHSLSQSVSSTLITSRLLARSFLLKPPQPQHSNLSTVPYTSSDDYISCDIIGQCLIIQCAELGVIREGAMIVGLKC